jgi:hypothetical protein
MKWLEELRKRQKRQWGKTASVVTTEPGTSRNRSDVLLLKHDVTWLSPPPASVEVQQIPNKVFQYLRSALPPRLAQWYDMYPKKKIRLIFKPRRFIFFSVLTEMFKLRVMKCWMRRRRLMRK